MKTKRVKAYKAKLPDRGLICYVILERDVRALAEQMAEDIFKTSNDKVLQDYVLYALKRAGMTPGKEAQ